MAEVILSTEDLTVLGGPSSISVDIDFGPEGVRGSQIFVGEGDPNDPGTVIGQEVKVLDIFINIKSSDPEYLYVYQYVSQDGVLSWKKLFKIIPNIKSGNYSANFVSGTATINVPVNQIVSSELVASAVAADFNVQVTVVDSNPTAHSIEIGEPTGSGAARSLPITIHAIEFDTNGNIWTELSGSKTVQLFITVV